MSHSALQQNHTLSLLVADGTQMACQLLCDALRRCHRFAVIGVTGSGEVLNTVASYRPQVAVLSANLDEDPSRGLRVTREIRTAHPETKVVVLLDSPQRNLVVEAFRAGGSGVFCRAESVKALCKCIEVVHKGQIWANSNELWFVLDALSKSAPLRVADARGVELLTERELQVVRCASEGLTNREIGTQLNLSEHSIKNYLFRIFDKMGISNRVELLLYVLSLNGNTHGSNLLVGTNNALGDAGESPLDAHRTAAEQGSDLAQLTLGKLYARGQGVERDLLASYKWLHLAEATNNFLRARIKSEKARIAKKMPAQQISEAQQQASIWLNDYAYQSTPSSDEPLRSKRNNKTDLCQGKSAGGHFQRAQR